MPPPKRPFTTSSLTSSLKSTLASQPLLSNLTNLDKLTSTASNLAHKAPFFDALNEQFQQARAQDSGARPAGGGVTKPAPPSSEQNGIKAAAFNTNHQRQDASAHAGVDMSHLTEQERLMIQSVIAKAELTDGGAPASATITGAISASSHMNQPMMQQHQQQPHQQQQPAQNQPANSMMAQPFQQSNMQQAPLQNVGPYQQASNMQPPQQQHSQPNYQQSSMNPGQQLAGGQMINQAGQLASAPLPSSQVQAQQQSNFGNPQSSMASSFDRAQAERFGAAQQAVANQQPANQQQQLQFYNQPSLQDPTRLSLAQQTQQLVNQINNQFSLGANSRDALQAPAQPSQNSQNFNAQQSIQNPAANIRQPQTINNSTANASLGQQTPFSQMQLAGQYGHHQQQDTLALAQQQQQQQQLQQLAQQQQQQQQQQQISMNAAAQRAHLMQQQGSQLSMPSSQVTNQAQHSPAFYNMQSQNVIGPTIPNIQHSTDIALQQQLAQQQQQQQQQQMQQQQMLFRDNRGNLPFLPNPSASFVANNLANIDAFNQQQAVQGQQQLYNPLANIQPESILRNRDARDGIRFRPDTFRDEFAMSDQEAYDERRLRRGGPRRFEDKSLRRYESLDAGSRSRQLSSERSREIKSASSRATPPIGLGKQRQLPKLGEMSKQQVQQAHPQAQQAASSKMRSTPPPPMKRSARLRREHEREASLSVSSDDSDELDDDVSFSLSETSQDRKSQRAKTQRALNKHGAVSPKQPPVAPSAAERELDERSINRMSELKLSEQASQVMEQQQLLIQQSQELIKLQQTQLENQSKNKEAQAAHQCEPPVVGQLANTSAPANAQKAPETTTRQASLEVKDPVVPCRNAPEAREPSRDAGNQTQEAQKPLTRAINKATSVDSTDLMNIESDSVDLGPSRVDQRLAAKKTRQASSRNLNSLERVSLSRYNHADLLVSPTDTTDSDVELLSHRSNSIRRHPRGQQSAQVKPTRATHSGLHRRGPAGLPPSPLPVGAAIQLHQLQQKHEPPISRSGKMSRQAFLRSKSVCNSPDLTAHGHFGRSIDLSQQQVNSPDTLSELGARRKRLPEPPSNSVPLTPLMVRKMIQAQNAAATNSSKLLTSVNAQSTLLTNMHSYRNPCFDRAPNEHLRQVFNQRGQQQLQQLRYSPMSAYLGRSTTETSAPAVSFVDPNKSLYGLSIDRPDQTRALAALSSDFSSKCSTANVPSYSGSGSILKPSTKFQDASAAPELDSMMRDISARYESMSNHERPAAPGLAGRMSRYEQLVQQQQQQQPNRLDPPLSNRLNSVAGYPSAPSASSCLPKPAYPLGEHLYGGPPSFRRSSEGENAMLARLGRPASPYASRTSRFCPAEQGGRGAYAMSPDRFRSESAAYKSFQAPPSPFRARELRQRRYDEYLPGARLDGSPRPGATGSARYPSQWPASQLESTASGRHLGASLDGMDPSGLDSARWSSSGLKRYANFRPDRFTGLDRELSQDRAESYLADASKPSARYQTSFASGLDSADRMSRLGANYRHQYRSLDLDA